MTEALICLAAVLGLGVLAVFAALATGRARVSATWTTVEADNTDDAFEAITKFMHEQAKDSRDPKGGKR